MGNPFASPDALEHSQSRDGVRCTKAVPGQRRRRHRLARRHPQQHRSISKDVQVCINPLDFVFGIGLYLAPSDMALHPGNFQGYNNEIVIVGSEAAIGHNPGINESEQISGTGGKSFEGKIAAPAGTDHKGPPSGKPAADVAEQRGHAADVAEQRGQERVWSRGRDEPRKRLS